MYYILKSGGLTTGGFNFDSKIRRQSIDPADLIHGHIGGMDVCARALKAAAKMIEDNVWGKYVEERYAGWNSAEAKAMLAGKRSLAEIAGRVEKDGINPKPRSGGQEYLENVINRYV